MWVLDQIFKVYATMINNSQGQGILFKKKKKTEKKPTVKKS